MGGEISKIGSNSLSYITSVDALKKEDKQATATIGTTLMPVPMGVVPMYVELDMYPKWLDNSAISVASKVLETPKETDRNSDGLEVGKVSFADASGQVSFARHWSLLDAGATARYHWVGLNANAGAASGSNFSLDIALGKEIPLPKGGIYLTGALFNISIPSQAPVFYGGIDWLAYKNDDKAVTALTAIANITYDPYFDPYFSFKNAEVNFGVKARGHLARGFDWTGQAGFCYNGSWYPILGVGARWNEGVHTKSFNLDWLTLDIAAMHSRELKGNYYLLSIGIPVGKKR